MLGTKFLRGQGLGNQLFVYVTSRCLAKAAGCTFATAKQEDFAMNIHNDKGMYFMDVDLGVKISEEEEKGFSFYDEREERLFLGNSRHDMEHGVYVTGTDETLLEHLAASGKKLPDNTMVMGNLQAEEYFLPYLSDVKQWLKVKAEYDSYEYSRENLCIINMRGGEYTGNPELFIRRKYWLKAMERMKEIRSDMQFMIITDDVEAAARVLPGIEAHHFDIGKDYVTIKNAHYLILSNSSFAILPSHTSETLQYAIAPKYWARFNVSDGYWASEQNIYSLYHYMDKHGKLFTAQECREELERYRKTSFKFRHCGKPAAGFRRTLQEINRRRVLGVFWIERILASAKRRLAKKLA